MAARGSVLSSVFGLAAFLLSVVQNVAGGEFCTYSYSPYTTEYCNYGCCGEGLEEYCCNISVGIIVGGVVGVIACICVVITVICCCIKQQSYRGRVVGAHGVAVGATNNVTVFQANTTTMGYPPRQQQPQPMGFPQQTMYGPPPPGGGHQQGYPPPPPYAYVNPAYPTPTQHAMGGGGGGGGFAAPAAPAYAPNYSYAAP